jgi:NDP-sugar pyrophosphorylase family protein
VTHEPTHGPSPASTQSFWRAAWVRGCARLCRTARRYWPTLTARRLVKKLIDLYAAAGVDRIVLALGYRAADAEEFIAHNSGTAEIIASVESEPLGTGGALRFALPKLRSKTVLVANGDSFADVDFAALLRLHRAKQSEITLALAFVADMRRYGRVIMGDDSAVTRFEEKAGADGPIEAGYANAGVYLVEQEVVAALPAGRRLSLELDVFPRMIGKLYALPQRIPFIDIGTPETWAAANDFFAEIEKRKVRP